MKAYKITLLVIDQDELGTKEISDVLESTKYPNWCISPQIKACEEADIGEWEDDHPLNQASTHEAEYKRLFSEKSGDGK